MSTSRDDEGAIEWRQTGFPARRSSLLGHHRITSQDIEASPELEASAPASNNFTELEEALEGRNVQEASLYNHNGESSLNISSARLENRSVAIEQANIENATEAGPPLVDTPGMVDDVSEATERRSFGDFDPSGHAVRQLSQTAGKWGPILRKSDDADQILLGNGGTVADKPSFTMSNVGKAFKRVNIGIASRLRLLCSKAVSSHAQSAAADHHNATTERQPASFAARLDNLVSESHHRRVKERHRRPARITTTTVARPELETVVEEDEPSASPLKKRTPCTDLRGAYTAPEAEQ